MYRPTSRLYASFVFAAACGHAAGTRPQEMSVAQHEAAATAESHSAQEHAAQYDPGAKAESEICDLTTRKAAGFPMCWTETRNPTEEHRQRADEHRELAAKHRAASQALRDAEARSCAGIADADRDMSPFAHTADIRGVAELKAASSTQSGKTKMQRTAGATVTVNAVPGLTEEWLQRIVDCHLARNAALGNEVPEMPYCPLVPRGAQASVRSVGDGFAVDIRADDPQTSAEIWRRAQHLTGAHGG